MAPAFHFHRSTPMGEGGVAVVELYGEGAVPALRAIFRPRGGSLPDEGGLRLGDVADARGEPIDEAIVTRVPAAGMWSRLPAWTISTHGGPWIQERIEALLEGLGGESLSLQGALGLSLAAGAMDAVEAAAHALLVEAVTEKAARFFLRQHAGELSALLHEGLDLARSGRVDESSRLLRRLSTGFQPAFRLGHPLRILIAGRPNAGKSTLFNRLVEDERAVVTSIPGTTRDTLEELIAIHDFPARITDSAGLRPLAGAGEVERLGILKVLARTDDAIVYLVPHPWRLNEEDRSFLAGRPTDRVLVVASLADLAAAGEGPPSGLPGLSALRGEGLEALRDTVFQRWIGGGLSSREEVPAAPFTGTQVAALLKALPRTQAAGGGAGALDLLESAYIECLGRSWPETSDPNCPGDRKC